MAKFGFGQSVKRVEDVRLIKGEGRYTVDVSIPGQAVGFVLRSPVAHATITSIDTSAAESAPGVLAVITGKELAAAGANNLPCLVPMKNVDGTDRADPGRPILAVDKVRHVGDQVAFVVAETIEQAKDAADLIMVDYDTKPAVADMLKAIEPGAPLVHDSTSSNLCFDWMHGDAGATDQAFASAAKTVKIDLINNKVIANSMEPRACVAEWDAAEGKLTMHAGTQGGWMFQDMLAEQVLKLPKDKVRVITPDVGGGFGMKGFFYTEYAMAAWAARKTGRPVAWISERAEGFLSDVMGRDHVTTAELAFDANNKVQAMRVTVHAGMGAYLSMFAPFIPTYAALKVLPGVYDIKALTYRVKGIFTHTTPVDAYRGAGRPESIYCVERLMDAAARQFGVDPVELRKLNYIKPEQMPYTTPAGETYDTGEFAKVTDMTMAKHGYDGFASRKAQSEAKGLLRGLGLAYYIESTMGNPEEAAAIKFVDDGTVEVWVGTQTNGQGHETAYAQVFADALGIDMENIRVKQGDTDVVKFGGGTGGSRSLTAQGVAIRAGAREVIKKGIEAAASHFETAAADISYEDGTFKVAGTDKQIDLFTLAKTVRSSGVNIDGLNADVKIKLDAWTFPNGCHIAEVEVDPDTGVTKVDRYTVIDDFGKVLNPMLVAGQVHGGVAQGIGQALFEQVVYDDSAQLISGSFMDYTMPRADNLPNFDTDTYEVLCKNNEMGVKGCGEAGSVGACGAVMNALLDALSPLGVERVDMPATPETVWKLIQAAQTKKAA
ncbi:xanthine dehydrogenase family protein molybdopterin-binding subunit [Geminicoccus roseus]|uniref:xanthine dehydrogenase family protein molybdopterin-binding subunit n=1 Tax=Geminicoccus roseus TaxID=404900 RepID=UPI00040C264A|nr:xanthine dehydrogenase family protein molybdopterin-binding subunit [Geminicoccus roseus]